MALQRTHGDEIGRIKATGGESDQITPERCGGIKGRNADEQEQTGKRQRQCAPEAGIGPVGQAQQAVDGDEQGSRIREQGGNRGVDRLDRDMHGKQIRRKENGGEQIEIERRGRLQRRLAPRARIAPQREHHEEGRRQQHPEECRAFRRQRHALDQDRSGAEGNSTREEDHPGPDMTGFSGRQRMRLYLCRLHIAHGITLRAQACDAHGTTRLSMTQNLTCHAPIPVEQPD